MKMLLTLMLKKPKLHVINVECDDEESLWQCISSCQGKRSLCLLQLCGMACQKGGNHWSYLPMKYRIKRICNNVADVIKFSLVLLSVTAEFSFCF